MALSPILVLGLLPSIVAGTGERARFQLDVGPEVQLAAAPSWQAQLAAGATLFLRPITDDATPLPLQPFLQSASTIALRLRGALDGDRVLAGQAEALADVYVTRWLALTASLGTAGAHALGAAPAADLSLVRVAAGVGFRVGDLRIDLGYRYAPGRSLDELPSNAALRNGGAIDVGLRAVVVERIDFQLRVMTSFGGDVIGRFECDYHASRRLGLLWGLVFGHGLYDRASVAPASPVEDLFGARFGLSFWWSPRVALTAVFTPAWHFYAGGTGTVEERLTAAISTRF